MANNSLILKHKNRRRYKSEHSKPDPQEPGRNEKCPCGSGKKYKHCHMIIKRQEEEAAWERAKERANKAFEDAKKEREKLLETGKAASPLGRRHSAMPLMLAAAAMAFSGGFGMSGVGGISGPSRRRK